MTEYSNLIGEFHYDGIATMADSKAEKKATHKREVQLKLDEVQAVFETREPEEDHEAVMAELKAADLYFEYLKPLFLEAKVSYEDRVKQRAGHRARPSMAARSKTARKKPWCSWTTCALALWLPRNSP